MEGIFESCVRGTGDLSGVFECDNETSYFYLYSVDARDGNKVLDSIKIGIGKPKYSSADIEIGWSSDESVVYLRIAGAIAAVFDCVSKERYGGDVVKGVAIPKTILARLML